MGKKLTFNFAYPNLYLITEKGECLLLTHGHYFEAYWSFAAEWALRLAGDDLGLEEKGELNMREMVGINLPLNQLACSGIGQSEPLTDLARLIQMEAAAGKADSLGKYLDRLVDVFREEGGVSRASRLARLYALRWLKRKFLSAVRGTERTRYRRNTTWIFLLPPTWSSDTPTNPFPGDRASFSIPSTGRTFGCAIPGAGS